MFMVQERVKVACAEVFGRFPGSIKKAPCGMSQNVYFAEVGEGKYVVRLYDSNFNLRVEQSKRKFFKPINTPRIIAGTDKYLIEEYVEGVHVSLHAKGSLEMYGATVRQLHDKYEGESRDQESFSFIMSKARAGALKLDSNRRKGVYDLLDGCPVPSIDAIVHGDLGVDNVLVSNDKLTLIDLDGAGYGSRSFDIANMYSRRPGSPMIKEFLRGYGRANTEEIWYFGLLHTLWRLNRSKPAKLENYFGRLERLLADRQFM
jgi:thiamine kinase-like enzyme